MAFLLPHELINCLVQHGDLKAILCVDGMDPKTLAHLRSCEEQAGCPLLGVGLWGDEVPCNWDRTESVATFALNLPGLAGLFGKLRLPITAISTKQCNDNTWHDICDVIAWSFTHAARGGVCSERHDQRAWLPSDRARSKLNPGRSNNFEVLQRAAFVEGRMDWVFLGKVFAFPKHNTGSGCCWVCRCKPEQVAWVLSFNKTGSFYFEQENIYIYIYIYTCANLLTQEVQRIM